jgi:TRAP-type mannitol/chloroaromatic compound transport system permease small subunit
VRTRIASEVLEVAALRNSEAGKHVPNPSRVKSYPFTLMLFISFILLKVRSRSRVTFIVNFMCQEADAESHGDE